MKIQHPKNFPLTNFFYEETLLYYHNVCLFIHHNYIVIAKILLVASTPFWKIPNFISFIYYISCLHNRNGFPLSVHIIELVLCSSPV